MNGAVPYFFFSYSQADTDEFLDRFFEDLRQRVANLSGLAIKKNDPGWEEQFDRVGFRDRYGVKTGEDWKEKIGTAIQRNGVLVCVYSPNFFSRLKTKEFCGQEFAAFLMRDPGIRYAPGTGEPEKEFQLQGARNILPIVWYKLRHLQNQKLPPYVVHSIAWTLSTPVATQVNTRYLEAGLRRIAMERCGEYDDILDHFAERIIDLAKDPLPPLPAVPDIGTLRNAFWSQPEESQIDRAAAASAVAQAVVASATRGPTRMLVIEVRAQGASDWSPYVGDQSIPALFEEVSNQKQLSTDWMTLDPSAADFMDRMMSALEDAADRSIRPIVVVDPRCLANGVWRSTLVGLLQRRRRAGFLVPADAADRDAVRLIEQYRYLLQPADDAPDWVVRISVGNMTQFRTAVSSVADDMLARIVKTDPVRQTPPDNAGPVARPRIANLLDAGQVK
ncbi:hypothetical protein ACVME8_008797 [Bradyrhizobium diazoefficiens]